jgi:hypothetical protein
MLSNIGHGGAMAFYHGHVCLKCHFLVFFLGPPSTIDNIVMDAFLVQEYFLLGCSK